MTDQEQPLDQDMIEETEEQKELRELMEDIALTEQIDYLKQLWENEK